MARGVGRHPRVAVPAAVAVQVPDEPVGHAAQDGVHHRFGRIAALAAVAPDPARSPDRLSARWLLALAARLVRETGALINGAARANKPLATFGLDAEVRFAKPADRAAFAGELTDALAGIISKYHTETGRPHRLIVAVHPSITEDADPPAEEQQQS